MLFRSMLPGGLGPKLQGMEIDEKEVAHIEAMIYSMTPEERQDPDMIDGKRRLRIAKGSGTTIQDVNQMLKQFREMRNMMKNFGKFGGMLGKFMPGFGGGGRGHFSMGRKKR